MVSALRLTAVGLTVAALGCGGGGSGAAPSPNITCSSIPNPATTFLILNNAVCPTSLTVPPGSRVTMINNDSRNHDMESDPHPEHTDCPELNQIGFLVPGQQRDSGNLNVTRRCGFHDHSNPDNRALQGAVIIQ